VPPELAPELTYTFPLAEPKPPPLYAVKKVLPAEGLSILPDVSKVRLP
jgi:hypothetical protein